MQERVPTPRRLWTCATAATYKRSVSLIQVQMQYSIPSPRGQFGSEKLGHCKTTMPANSRHDDQGGEVPSLDFESSTISSTSPISNGLNPQAPCFHANDRNHDADREPFDHHMPFYSGEIPIIDQTNTHTYFPANGDITWMLMDLSARLGSLEEAVLTGNAQMYQFHAKVTETMNKSLVAMDEFSITISNLKKSLKDFVQAFLGEAFGEDMDNVEVKSEA
ncbi:hypothetical protein HDV57DRAFT_488134 [Trichoderma longibrachiatum]